VGDRRRVVAVAHLLRYGAGPEINPAYHNLGEIDWVFAWPDAKEATEALFAAADRQFAAWGVREAWVHGGTLVGPFVGIPDVWPHIALFLRAAGYEPAEDQDEMIYGGRIEHIALPGESPIPGLTLQRASGLLGTRFTVWLEDQRIGHCECVLDLTEGDALPALRGWAELAEIEIEPQCRRRGIGTWLVQHAVEWLRFGRCDRIILAVSAEAEASGADRFYQRFGWSRLARQTKQWKRKAQRQT
jgi:GNAT superfamily N-acetyltransferase